VLQDVRGRGLGVIDGVTRRADGSVDQVLIRARDARGEVTAIPAEAVSLNGAVAVTALTETEVRNSPRARN
jgi:hypothetical protein